jgi:hypothetical protein
VLSFNLLLSTITCFFRQAHAASVNEKSLRDINYADAEGQDQSYCSPRQRFELSLRSKSEMVV